MPGPAIAQRSCCCAFGAVIIIVAATLCQADVVYVDDSAPVGGDGMSWPAALDDLHAALDLAGDPRNAITEIRIAQGLYRPSARTDPSDSRSATFSMLSGVRLAGGYAGVGAKDPDQRDVALYPTILSGDLAGDDGAPGSFVNYEENVYHVVTAIGVDDMAALDGVVIAAGSACCVGDQDDPRRMGGGWHIGGGGPVALDCTFRHNRGHHGGGVGVIGAAPSLTRCTFTGNAGFVTDFTTGEGGGVYSEASETHYVECAFVQNTADRGAGLFHREGTAMLTNCEFSANAATDKGGAAFIAFAPFEVTGCTFDENTSLHTSGAIRASNGPGLIDQCTFTGNTTEAGGGAASISGGDVVIRQSTFTGNRAMDFGHGGALSINLATISIDQCQFINNQAASSSGAIMLYSDSHATVTRCLFRGNAATRTGVMGGGSNLSLSECDFESNISAEGPGALGLGGNSTVTNCTFTGNRALDNNDILGGGGAVSLWDFEGAIIGCRFTGNTSGLLGGAITNRRSTGGPYFHRPVLANCLFINNRALSTFGEGKGGAIYTEGGSAEIINCTFAGNVAGDNITSGPGAGAIHTWIALRPVLIDNSIVWGNLPEQIKTEFGETEVNYCNVQGGWSGLGTGNIDAEPLFVDAAAGDWRPAPGSPCIDAADSLAVPPLALVDLDGLPRLRDDPETPDTGPGQPPVVDMGAHEFQALTCAADCAPPHDGIVDVNDLLAVLQSWGGFGMTGDVTADGVVDVDDLIEVILAWGPCL